MARSAVELQSRRRPAAGKPRGGTLWHDAARGSSGRNTARRRAGSRGVSGRCSRDRRRGRHGEPCGPSVAPRFPRIRPPCRTSHARCCRIRTATPARRSTPCRPGGRRGSRGPAVKTAEAELPGDPLLLARRPVTAIKRASGPASGVTVVLRHLLQSMAPRAFSTGPGTPRFSRPAKRAVPSRRARRTAGRCHRRRSWGAGPKAAQLGVIPPAAPAARPLPECGNKRGPGVLEPGLRGFRPAREGALRVVPGLAAAGRVCSGLASIPWA